MSANRAINDSEAVSRRYQSLLAVTESISSHSNLAELFKELPAKLRPVVDFDAVAVVLHDAERDAMRLQLFESNKSLHDIPIAGEAGPVDSSPEGLVWQTQRPMLITPVSKEKRFPAYMSRIRAENIETLYSIPLTSSERKLGAIAFGSGRENAYNDADLEFLGQVARQVAVAVDNVLNLERAERERDRNQLLLEVGKAVTSRLSLGDLLQTVSSCLRQFINHDFASVVLCDEESGQLRVHGLDAPREIAFAQGSLLPLEGTPAGLAIKMRQTVWRDRLDFEEFFAPQVRIAYEHGVRSGCSTPLISHGQVLGVLNVASRHEAAFTTEEVKILEEIAGQVAIAVENALNFQRAERERDRIELLLRTNNAVTSHLNLRDLLNASSVALRDIINHEVVGLALYDEKTDSLRVRVLEGDPGIKYVEEGFLISLEGSPAARAYSTRQPIVIDLLSATEFHSPVIDRAVAAGVKSTCSVPLLVEDRALGAMFIGSRSEAAFSQTDAQLLTHVAGQIAIAVENALNFERAERERDRKQLLLEVSNAIVADLSPTALLRTVSGYLRRFFNHDFASVMLYDEPSGKLRVHALDADDPGVLLGEGTLLPFEDTPLALAMSTRQTVRRDYLDLQEFPSHLVKQSCEIDGIRSICSVPLVSHDRVLGTLNVVSRCEAAFSEADAELLEEIADQVAIAVENALNLERATKEWSRAETLLEINNAISTNLDLNDLLRATSESLRGYFEHDFAGLAWYDEEAKQMVTNGLDLSRPSEYLIDGAHFPVEGTLNGLAFTTREPVVRHQIDLAETSWASARQFFLEQGLKSYYCVPLLSRGRAVGVLNLGSRKENAISDKDVRLLQQIGTQIAIAVENSLVYRQLTALKNKLTDEKFYLEEEIRTEHNFAEIVGESPALKRILQQVATVAPTDSAVLLCGETGTGKELIARAIHNLSGRRERTLVKLNCAAIPTGLLESELFGHEKGAFTGAISPRVGRFELAHKGTLLLDEIGEIPLELQPKLLRVLQEQEFERLGSSRTIKTDVRLIAATNVDLPQMVAEKKFRSDLYYRLNVFPIIIPPLRERTGDISLLAGYFTQKHALRMNKKIQTVSKETIEALYRYSWPGNVRELENFIERAVILTSGSELQAPLYELGAAASVASSDGHKVADGELKPVTLEDVERAHIEEILKQTRGVIGGKGGAAEILGLPISTLRNRMKKLGLK